MGSMVYVGSNWNLQILKGCKETYEEWQEETDAPLYSDFMSNDVEIAHAEGLPGLRLRRATERAKGLVAGLVGEYQLDPQEDLIVLVYEDEYADEESLDDYDEEDDDGESWEAVRSDPLFGNESYLVLWPADKATEDPILGEIIPASRERDLKEQYGENLAGYFDDDAGRDSAITKED